ncbi:hypothetical protein [Bosea minatitlanensis]|uniref:Uncharacterized protein n=1 Tax=Bosea minatitlanensis TaxID=128782 RepID=A0ABW0EX32_9HYPH|nr:hypothetical protein [Bosea minatitlanensis]MCT4495397.1 hypothetical protein [Bosea minatitlanensis]
MAVVKKYARSYKDPATVALPPAAFVEGRVRCITTGPVAIASGDSATSRLYLGKVPSSAIILPMSTLYHGALTGVSDFDIGVEKDGTTVSIDALADGLNLTSAGNKSVVAKLATGSIGKRLFEVLGLATDPGCEYDLVGTLKADASADGVLEAFVLYAKK